MHHADASRAVSVQLRRVRCSLHGYLLETELRALRHAIKANFNPNQPRVPAGNPGGGQWTDAGGGRSTSGGAGSDALVGGGAGGDDVSDLPDHLSDVRPRPRKLPRDIQGLSDIPREKPSSIQVANAIIKFVAYEFADYLMRQGERPLAAGPLRTRLFRRLLIGFEVALWVRDEALPAIESYYDPPRTLEELQDGAASGSRPGYEIHHIVELNDLHPVWLTPA